MFSSYSDNPLSNIEVIRNNFCFGKDPTKVWTPEGEVMDELKLHKYCCRRIILGNVHLISYI